MELRGKNTNNTLVELKQVLADIESGKCSTDGYSGAIADIKEDIAQLEQQPVSLEQAAHNHYRVGSACNIGSYGRSMYENKKDSFMAGANWQKEQDKELLTELANTLSYVLGLTMHTDKEQYILDLHERLIERLQL